MTIYLRILKEFLIRNISHWQTKSIAKEQSTVNTLGGFLGFGRDVELSKFKQRIASELIIRLQQFETTEVDEKSLKDIEGFLINAKNIAATEANKKGYDQGTFSKMMDQTYVIAKDIFEKFKKFKLLDIHYSSNDPFDIYRYYLAAYLSQKVYDLHHPSIIKYYSEHPKISNMALLTQEREVLVKEALDLCIKKLDRLDKANPDYLNARKDSIMESIDALKRDNEQLCTKHGVELAMPIFSVGFASLNMGMPPLQPDNGCIEICMASAIELIEKIKVVTQVPEPRAKQIGDFFAKVSSKEAISLDKQAEPNL